MATTSKTDWLDRIEHGRATWEELVAQAGDDGMERPGVTGDWTFKDVTGHLNGWRERTVSRLEAAAAGTTPARPSWPEGLDAESDEGVDEGVDAINRWLDERNRDRPAADLLAEAREQFARMRAAVEAIPAEDFERPVPWLDGEPISAVIAGSLDHLHEEHEPTIRAWLAGGAG